ncbi:MAG: heavy-metal-associated domain-containing protein [Lachnospiraceae bacterium]|nr:heavy-metal-associated domain-containing protein [Lachnospiraceae bacterium]
MSQTLSNIICLIVIAAILFLAVKYSIPHFKGEGACCGGGGGKLKLVRPRKLDHIVAVKTIHIEGMTCDHCAARIHNALNSVDGVNAKVTRSRAMARVRLGRDIDDEKLREVITDLGYKVVSIE